MRSMIFITKHRLKRGRSSQLFYVRYYLASKSGFNDKRSLSSPNSLARPLSSLKSIFLIPRAHSLFPRTFLSFSILTESRKKRELCYQSFPRRESTWLTTLFRCIGSLLRENYSATEKAFFFGESHVKITTRKVPLFLESGIFPIF